MLKFLQATMKPNRLTRLIWATAATGETLEDICRSLRRLSVDVSDAQLTMLGLQDLVTASGEKCTKTDLVRLAQCMKVIDDILRDMELRAADLCREIGEFDAIHRGVQVFVRRHSTTR
jgi:hypothetical protein